MIRKAWLIPVFLLGLAVAPEASAAVSFGFSVGRLPPMPRGHAYGPVGRAPAPGFFWREGFWDVRNRGYYWMPGQWVRAPRANAYWVGPRWHGNAWRPGYWR